MNRYILTKAGIDVNEGIHRFNGNKELYEKFLTSFPEDIHYEQMLEAIEQKDVDAAFQGAHALKGITGTVSLAKLHSLLIPLVEELRAGSMEKVPELLPPVKEAYDENIVVKQACDETVITGYKCSCDAIVFFNFFSNNPLLV